MATAFGPLRREGEDRCALWHHAVMGFRDDYEAQLQRNAALEAELDAARRREAELKESLDEARAAADRENGRPGSPRAQEGLIDLRELAARLPIEVETTGWPAVAPAVEAGAATKGARSWISLWRRVAAIVGMVLGCWLILSTSVFGATTVELTLHDWVDVAVYSTMSVLLVVAAIAYVKWPDRARPALLLWGAVGVAIEVVENTVDRVLFGHGLAPLWYAALLAAFPAALIVLFWKREADDVATAGG